MHGLCNCQASVCLSYPASARHCYGFAAVGSAGTLKTRDWKTRDREKYGGGKRRTGKRGTKSQGWKRRDWKTRDQSAWVEFTGLENAGPNFQGGKRTTIVY